MDNEFQKRWERIQQALAVELSGEVKPRVSSGRTLFEEEYAAKRRTEKDAPSQNKNICPRE